MNDIITDLEQLRNIERAKKLLYQDLRNSGIDDETIARNFRPILGADAFDLAYPDVRLNQSGSLPAKWARLFNKLETFIGWECNGRIRHLAGEPFRNEDGTPRRYMTVLGGTTPITFIDPSDRAVALCEARYHRQKPEGMSYWDWVECELLPIVITEGEKKAAALICVGIPAISLPGIFTGFNALKDDWGRTVERLLRAELKRFDNAGRSVGIMFDYREGCEFTQSVEFKAAAILSRQFRSATVRVAELPGPDKGVDDYLVRGLIQVVEAALISAKPAVKYEHLRLWLQYRKFNEGGVKTTDKFFDAEEPADNTATFVKSNLNSGKSQWFGRKISKVVKDSDGKIKSTAKGVKISLGHRNSLQLQLCKRWDFDHLDLHNAYGRLSDPNLQVALCFDSLLKLPLEMFPGSDVVIDESFTAIKHLLMSKTIRHGRLEIIQRFEYIVRVCNRIILMDGNNTDFLVEYISKIDPSKTINIRENESPRETPPVYFVDDDAIGARKVSEWLNLQILEAQLPAVVVDSITKAEAIAEQLQKLRGDGLLITSKTAPEKYIQRFLDDPDLYIDKFGKRVNWMVCTPTIESGVSIEKASKFDTLLCWFVGVVGVNEAVQMSRRVRNPQRIIVYAPKVGIQHGRNEGALEQLLLDNLETRIAVEASAFVSSSLGDKVMATLREQLDSPHVHTWLKYKAIEQLETKNYREFLFLAFDAMGMKPERIEAYEVNSDAYKTAKLEVQIIECTQIFNAPDIDWQEADRLSKKLDSNWGERCQVAKFHILDKFPGLALSPLWSVDFIHRLRYRERALSSQLEMFWLFTHPEESKALQAQKWQGKESIDFFIPDRVGDRWLFLEALNRLGFRKFLDGERYCDTSAEVVELLGTIRRRSTVSAVVGHPGEASNCHFINNKLFKTLGVKPKRLQVRLSPVARGVEGERKTFFWYDRAVCHPDNWEELIGYVDRKFQTLLGAIEPEKAPDSDAPNRSTPVTVDTSAMGENGILSPENVETENYVINPETLNQGEVKECYNIIQTENNTLTETTQPPIFKGFGARSGETVAEQGDGAIGDCGASDAEEGHKIDSEDFVAVWVQFFEDDRPQYAQGILDNCDFEEYHVRIRGVIYRVPTDSLFWEPPEPS